MIDTLDEIMTKYSSDKASWAHNYCPNYEKWFEPIRDRPITLFELGIDGGASLLGWQDYFPNGKIVGLDKDDKRQFETDRIVTYQSDQTDSAKLDTIIGIIGCPDIIIDDCSHINELTIKTFKLLFSKLKPGGIYVIEDLQCAYRWDFGGSKVLNDIKLETIMNYLFSMLHDLNPVKWGDPDYINNPEFTGVVSVHFYSDMVVIKKAL